MADQNGLPLITARHFEGASQDLRTFHVDGAPWFIAKDVCDVLGLANRTRALAGLDDDEKGFTTVNTVQGPQRMLTVNESGLYALVLRSRKPAARAFRKWVTSVVLPAIRRDGGYIRGEELLNVDGMSLRQLEEREVLLASASCRFPRGCSPEVVGEDGGSHAKPSTQNNLG